MSNTILTATGRYFDFDDPAGSEFGIIDIAHALSHQCRFTGHTRRFYSVAQHSVLVSQLVPPEMAFMGLMHDAAEAFVGDMARPLKQLLPEYKAIELCVEQAIFERFGLPHELPPEVKHADNVALATEKRDLMMVTRDEWHVLQGVRPCAHRIWAKQPSDAKLMFLRRVRELRPDLMMDGLLPAAPSNMEQWHKWHTPNMPAMKDLLIKQAIVIGELSKGMPLKDPFWQEIRECHSMLDHLGVDA